MLVLTIGSGADYKTRAPIYPDGSLPRISSVKPPKFNFVSPAAAQDHSTGSSNPVRIVDIKKSGTVVTKRVQLPDNSCVDQTIDSYTDDDWLRKQLHALHFMAAKTLAIPTRAPSEPGNR